MQRRKKKLDLDLTSIKVLATSDLAKVPGGGTSDGAVCTAIYEAYWRVFLK